MSISSRRNSALKSSISIKSISNTAAKFSKSLSSARSSSQDIQKQLRETNQFKRNLIRKDNIFFRRRQENIRRKDREDELEASSVTGTSKRQGSLLAKSTRGFLGRILDFLGILLLGWAATNLPKILMGINTLINNIKRVGGILGFFVNGVKDVVLGIGSMIGATLGKLLNFDFISDKSKIDKELEGTQGNVQKTQRELAESANLFTDPENFGLENPPGFEVDTPQEQKSKETSNVSDAGAEPTSVDGNEGEKREIEGVVNDIGKSVESKGEDPVSIEGESDSIEGVETDTGGVTPQRGGGAKSAPATASSSIEDPREVLKKKQDESIKRNQKTKNRNDRRKSSFLGTPSSVENINESVTPKESTMLASVGEYDADFESGQGGSRKVNFSSLVTPTKKDVDVKTSRKPTRTVMIMEKPVDMSSPSVAMASGGGGTKLTSSAVEDEKTLMKLQSSSTLKYT